MIVPSLMLGTSAINTYQWTHRRSRRLSNALDGIVQIALRIRIRRAERNDIIADRDAHGERDRCVDAHRLPHDGVEVWKFLKLVHRGVLGWDTQQLLAQLALHLRSLAQREQAVGGHSACRFVACYKEPVGDLAMVKSLHTCDTHVGTSANALTS